MYFINHTWFEPQRALIVVFNYVYNLNGFFSCCVNGEKMARVPALCSIWNIPKTSNCAKLFNSKPKICLLIIWRILNCFNCKTQETARLKRQFTIVT